MGQALYRKYRSKTLDEVIGQDHITSTLKHAVKDGTFSHAYLFTGPRGVGKTSIARILAHEVNKLPYDENTTHLDIIEIDAASNRRIDEIRDLRDKVHVSPTSAKYKVYIVDEVHMLTKEAFNALLKTLEEPPDHVIFILATTELNKLPDTIISRTQHFSFKPISNKIAVEHLLSIAESENIKLDSAAAEVIAEHGDGSFRDSISLLDKLKTNNTTIDLETANLGLGLASGQFLDQVISDVKNGTPKSLIDLLDNLRTQGIQSNVLAKQLAKKLRDEYLVNSDKKTLQLYKELVNVQGKTNSELLLDVVLLEAQISNADHKPLISPKEPPNAAKEPEISVQKTNRSVNSHKNTEPVENTEATEIVNSKIFASSEPGDEWDRILEVLKKHHSTLYSVLRISKPEIYKDKIVLKFRFPFHYKQVGSSDNLDKLAKVVQEVSGHNKAIICEVDSEKRKTPPDADIVTINNIFGGSEVLES